jgi:hypothetical protein
MILKLDLTKVSFIEYHQGVLEMILEGYKLIWQPDDRYTIEDIKNLYQQIKKADGPFVLYEGEL